MSQMGLGLALDQASTLGRVRVRVEGRVPSTRQVGGLHNPHVVARALHREEPGWG